MTPAPIHTCKQELDKFISQVLPDRLKALEDWLLRMKVGVCVYERICAFGPAYTYVEYGIFAPVYVRTYGPIRPPTYHPHQSNNHNLYQQHWSRPRAGSPAGPPAARSRLSPTSCCMTWSSSRGPLPGGFWRRGGSSTCRCLGDLGVCR